MMISSDIMNSPAAYRFQLQAAEAAAAATPPVHAADDDEPEPPTPKSLLLELEAQGTSDAPAELLQSSSVAAPMDVAIVAEPTKCPECPKWFVSEKAMFGHLRKHPDRGYKGATRPAPVAGTAAALAGDQKMSKKKQPLLARNEADVSALNLAAAVATKWLVTAKRGRAPFAPGGERVVEAGKQATSDAEDEEAAMILLGIASSSHSTTSETQQASVQQAVHAPDAASGHQMPEDEPQPILLDGDHVAGDNDNNLTLLEAGKIVQPASIVLEVSAESQTPPPAVKEVDITTEALHQVFVIPAANKPVAVAPSPGSGSSVGGAKQKAKKQRCAVVYHEQTAAAATSPPPAVGADGTPAVWRIPSPASNKRHVCPNCGKWFSTYQALGGHMSSHVKAKAGVGAAQEELAAAAARHNILAHRSLSGGGSGLVLTAAASTTGSAGTSWGQGHQQPPALLAALSAAAPHVCAVCHMTFPSGQALGGHKRKHWFPEKYQAAKAAAPAAEAAAPVPAAVPAPRDFDLNELPEGEGESDQP